MRGLSIRSIFVLLLIFSNIGRVAYATPVAFTFDGFGTGALDGVSFVDSNFVVSIFADTNDIVMPPFIPGTPIPLTGVWVIGNLSGTISINGFSIVTFADPLYVFSNTVSEGVGFGGLSGGLGGDFIDVIETGVGIDSYELATNFSAFDANPLLFLTSAATTGGILGFDTVRDTTFTAQVTAVPEPYSLILLSLGLVSLGFNKRKKR